MIIVNALQGNPFSQDIVAIELEIRTGIDQPADDIPAAGAEHSDAVRYHRGDTTDFHCDIGTIGWAQFSYILHQCVVVQGRHVDGFVRAEFSCRHQSMIDGIEADDEARTARLGDGAAVEAEQT